MNNNTIFENRIEINEVFNTTVPKNLLTTFPLYQINNAIVGLQGCGGTIGKYQYVELVFNFEQFFISKVESPSILIDKTSLSNADKLTFLIASQFGILFKKAETGSVIHIVDKKYLAECVTIIKNDDNTYNYIFNGEAVNKYMRPLKYVELVSINDKIGYYNDIEIEKIKYDNSVSKDVIMKDNNVLISKDLYNKVFHKNNNIEQLPDNDD
jgi:hypothetical protein